MPRDFFDVPLTAHRTSQGLVELPIRYRDVSAVVALFRVPELRARELLAGTPLEPALTRGGRSLAGLAFYEYRDTTIGAYGEVGLALLVRPARATPPRLAALELFRAPRERELGAFIVDLPVSTAIANAAGRELWGFPKFVTRLPFALATDRFDAAVLDPGGEGEIVRLSGELGRGVPAPPLSLTTYSMFEGELIRTPVEVRGAQRLRRGGGLRLELGESRHAMVEHLRGLGLGEASPVLVATTDRFQSLLHAGARVAR